MDHCWHGDGIVLTSNPPQHPETCCNCGARRRKISRPNYEDGHGPFAARRVHHYETTYFYSDERGKQPCVPGDD